MPQISNMDLKHFTYFLLLMLLLVISLAFSFGKKVQFYSKLKYLFPAIALTGIIFLLWDMRFIQFEMWYHNPAFLTGLKIMKIPMEDWFFFLVVPYSFVLVYETLKVKFPLWGKPNITVAVSLVLLIVFGLIAYFGREKLYTFFTFFLLAIYFGYTIFRNRFKEHFSKFYLAFLFSLIPLFLIEIAITALPIMEYNSDHIMGLKLATVPVENFGYLFLLLFINVTVYEFLKQQRFY